MTFREFKIFAQKELAGFSKSAGLDAQVLLMHILGLSKTQILLKDSTELLDEQKEWLLNAVQKRKTGLPVAYITEKKEFFGYEFFVNKDVLIPKPDTEILVEQAVGAIKSKIKANSGRILTVCDMCTGSGCIGISVLKELAADSAVPREILPQFTLADISEKALNVAKKNASSLLLEYEAERVRFVRSNLFEQIPYVFDFILTNPPYVPCDMTDELLKDGRNEPRLALDGDVTESGAKSRTTDGLAVIKRLLPQAYEHLALMGGLFMETGEYNAKKARELAKKTGFVETCTIQDLEGQPRVTVGWKK